MPVSQRALAVTLFALVACSLIYSFSAPRLNRGKTVHFTQTFSGQRSNSSVLLSSPPVTPPASPLVPPPAFPAPSPPPLPQPPAVAASCPLSSQIFPDPRLDHVVIIAKTGKETMNERLLQQVTTFLPRFRNVVYVSDAPGRLGTATIHAFPHPKPWLSGWAKDAPKYVGGYGLAWSLFPDKDWYFIIDDDTYIFAENLLAFLAPINASIPYQLGWAFYGGGCKMVGASRPTPAHRFIQGGGGILVSRGAFREFLPAQQECAERTATCLTGDQAIGACLAYLGVAPPDVDHPFGFFMHDWRAGSPRFNQPGVDPPEFIWAEDPCRSPVTAHRMREHDVQDAFDAEMATDPIRKPHTAPTAASEETKAGPSWGGWGRTTFADLMEFQLFRPETVIGGRYWYNATEDTTASTAQKTIINNYRIVMEGKKDIRDSIAWDGDSLAAELNVKNIPSCILLCVEKPRCLAFLYEPSTKTCKVYSRLGGRSIRIGVASGVIRERYQCQLSLPPFVEQ
ncbi:uncharacterized protein EV422DRAFT_86546 [Fimicolochytrium jonesii]|uniref:uncharacterized protein n=1 Tax=Fimicolochytrium jonesii TaxID=1396493 RepID=UPI0022FE6190|nr:uncharacterized protein EV422DRAFT_86546 [Fimicolochytrium jonesii]KAI8819812.1 hypothetical protein EV422DRAFT_86546 [Fimicolochytrium jonesii]